MSKGTNTLEEVISKAPPPVMWLTVRTVAKDILFPIKTSHELLVVYSWQLVTNSWIVWGWGEDSTSTLLPNREEENRQISFCSETYHTSLGLLEYLPDKVLLQDLQCNMRKKEKVYCFHLFYYPQFNRTNKVRIWILS